MAEDSRERFVPSGVNAQSWLGFEQRIQERRFRALLLTIDQAVARRDAAAARMAFEEACELRPGAPELSVVEERLARLPVAVPPAGGYTAWSRALGAVMMLLVGVSLLMGIDWLRASPEDTTELPAVMAPELRIAAPAPAAATEEPAVTIVAPPVVNDLVGESRQIGTSGLERRIRPVLDSGRLRAASTIDVTPALPRGEIPDDFVFVPPAPLVEAAPAPPAPRLAPPSPRPSSTAASVLPTPTSPLVAPPRDESRVAAVLNQYARAYGRLDAGAAREVWPSVDERALSRAFDNLTSQSVSFDDCSIAVQGPTANASCRGTTSYVGKVGSREPRTEPRTWRFELRRDGEAWKIENAAVARQ